MKIHYFCPRWGAQEEAWDTFCARVKAAGYHGVEWTVPTDPAEKDEQLEALDKHGLKLVGQYYQSFEADFELHKKNYEKLLLHIASAKPVHIDSQTGKDYHTTEQQNALFAIAQRVSAQTGIRISHETHRNKIFFAAHVSKQILAANPELLITADFSHWCCVAESLLEDQTQAVALACERAVHIHARVGHAQGPQISNPQAPEYATELQTHLAWWDQVVANRSKDNTQILTISPEFGPLPYMPAQPFSQEPLASQWDNNVYILNLLKQRYAQYN
jgi:sugar phosphate isomerase/epimerase